MNKSRLSFARYSPSRRKQRRRQRILATVVGFLALLIGGPLLEGRYGRGVAQSTLACLLQEERPVTSSNKSNKSVFSLVSLPNAQRRKQLEAIASGPKSIERSRARYLLASDLIQQNQGQKALALLDGLECEYPALGTHIALQRAKAYEVMGDKAKAQKQWQALLKRYPDSPVAAEALWALDKKSPQDWEQALEKFPGHPHTLELVRSWLKKDPYQPQLMLLLAKYSPDQKEISKVLDELTTQPAREDGKRIEPLKPEDWEVIALGYWNQRKYSPASAAYAKAPQTANNAYMAARGLQLAEKSDDAISAYEQMVKQFPREKETASALFQLAKLQSRTGRVPYFDQIINQFPDRAGEALLAKAKTLDRLQSSQAADKARDLLLSQYSNSDAAAEYRWTMAKTKARAGDLKAAVQWAQPIINQNTKSEFARQAGFWVGKWSKRLGHKQDAKAAFEQVLTNYPQSFYAWRSAVSLGLDVKDFTTVRKNAPQIIKPVERPVLPTGSTTLKELYQLGQDQEAWDLWQAEFHNRLKPTVLEQFTDGILHIAAGDYLAGIDRIGKLEDRDTPQEQAQYQALKQQSAYWHALYPFPFQKLIETWSKQRHLNPLLVTALIRQESRFMPTIRSSAQAVGLMQVMPETANSVAKKINLQKYALDNPNDNVNLGTWILEETHLNYRNNSLLAVASYNAGSTKVEDWLGEKQFTDPDEFIEAIPFAETKDYVKQVFGNYWNYMRLYNPEIGQQVAKYAINQPITLRP